MAFAAVVEESFGERLKLRLEHHSGIVLMMAAVAAIGIGVAPLPVLVSFYAPLAVVTIVIVAFAMTRSHEGKLCELCIGEFATNPARDARRYRRRLWLVHTLAEPRFMVLYVAVLAGSHALLVMDGRDTWVVGVWVAVQLSLPYLLLCVYNHRRVQPWCPWVDRAAARRRFRKRRHSCTPATQPA